MLPMDMLHVEEFPPSKNTHEEEVQAMTLRDAAREYQLSPPDFIKMDVQGFEDRVIRGGKDVIRMATYCLMEISLVPLYHESLLFADMNAVMRELGFRLIRIVGEVIGKSGEILQIDGLYKNDHPLARSQ
jgi:hypothetical protein